MIYGILIRLYGIAIRLSSFWSAKAKKWLIGRKSQAIEPKKEGTHRIWMHCASLGEFEQGRTVLDELKTLFPNSEFVLSFFSPSGYNWVDRSIADQVLYLPLDTKTKVNIFLDELEPDVIIMVKYEFWPNLFREIKKRRLQLFMISVVIKKGHFLFRSPFKSFGKNIFSAVSHFFVQTEADGKKLKDYSHSVCGDSRVDRVLQLSAQEVTFNELLDWKGESTLCIAGSTWNEDERVLLKAMETLSKYNLKLLLLPHERSSNKTITQIDSVEELKNHSKKNTIILNQRGVLSKIYRHADFCFIGGAFKTGLHNTLEAAVYSKPVFFGPQYHKFAEAKMLIDCGGGFSVNSDSELSNTLSGLIENSGQYKIASEAAGNYVQKQAGASTLTASKIKELVV